MKLYLLILSAAFLASCSKSSTTPQDNTVTVTGSVQTEVDNTSPGLTFWRMYATISKPIPDSSFVIIQWDAVSGSGTTLATGLKDTVKIGANSGGSPSRRASFTRSSSMTGASNIKVLNAWSKTGQYSFQY
jgi:hypothetical protein